MQLRDRSSLAPSACHGMLSRPGENRPVPRTFGLAINPVHGPRGCPRPRLSTFMTKHARATVRIGAGFGAFRPCWRAMNLVAAMPDDVHPVVSGAIEVIVSERVRRISGKRALEVHRK